MDQNEIDLAEDLKSRNLTMEEKSLLNATNYLESLEEEINKTQSLTRKAEKALYRSTATVISRLTEKQMNQFFFFINGSLFKSKKTLSSILEIDTLHEFISSFKGNNNPEEKNTLEDIQIHFSFNYPEEYLNTEENIMKLLAIKNTKPEYEQLVKDISINRYIIVLIAIVLLTKINFKYCVINYILLEAIGTGEEE